MFGGFTWSLGLELVVLLAIGKAKVEVTVVSQVEVWFEIVQ